MEGKVSQYRTLMYVRVSPESVRTKGREGGELTALGGSGRWGFPQVASGKFADWSESIRAPGTLLYRFYSYPDWLVI